MVDAPRAAAEPSTLVPAVDFESAFQNAPVAMAIIDRDLRYLACNHAMAEINGIPCEDHLGRTVGELLPDLIGEVEHRFGDGFTYDVSTHDVRVVGRTPKDPQASRVWLESTTPLKTSAGAIEALLVSVQEITALEVAEAALRESEQIFRASQQLRTDSFSILRAVRAPDGSVTDFIWDYANPAAEDLFGQGGLVGRRLLEVMPASREHPALFPRYLDVLAGGIPNEAELRFEIDGMGRLYRNSAAALDAERLALATQDLSDHLRTEERLRLIGGELRHRLKNMISIAMGLISQTAKSARDVNEFMQDLMSRFEALGWAQDLLLGHSGPVQLSDVLHVALRPFGSERLRVEMGPAVGLQESDVVPLALAFNELATNAVKYGALSGDDGRVQLGWKANGRRVVLTWSESSSRRITPPGREGLGTRLLADVAAKLPAGQLKREYQPEGLHIELCFEAEPAQ